MSGRLVHIGSAVVDYVYRIDALPSPGMEKTASSFARVAGGGFNMMVSARRTGMKVVFGGQLGSGPNGDFLRAAFGQWSDSNRAATVSISPGPAISAASIVLQLSHVVRASTRERMARGMSEMTGVGSKTKGVFAGSASIQSASASRLPT